MESCSVHTPTRLRVSVLLIVVGLFGPDTTDCLQRRLIEGLHPRVDDDLLGHSSSIYPADRARHKREEPTSELNSNDVIHLEPIQAGAYAQAFAGSFNTNQLSSPDVTSIEQTNSTDNEITSKAPHSNATIDLQKAEKAPTKLPPALLNSTKAHFDLRDITYFLESHPAHSVHDPRSYFTDEKMTRALSIILGEAVRLPIRLRFAFVARAFNEFGRKVASKMNTLVTELAAILRRTPDDLGNKPEVSMLVDAVQNALESKFDRDSADDQPLAEDGAISKLIGEDAEKKAVLNSTMVEVSKQLSKVLNYFIHVANETSLNISYEDRAILTGYLCESLITGARIMMDELEGSDKFRVSKETKSMANNILTSTCALVEKSFDDIDFDSGESVKEALRTNMNGSFKDLNSLSDKSGLEGAWNSYMFTNLGTSERVIKLMSSLLSRVPPHLKSRWINTYISQVDTELRRTLSGFVMMQGMPYNSNVSQVYLLNPVESAKILPVKVPRPRPNYTDDKSRIPARCYLAGRRWRLVLSKGLDGYDHREMFLNQMADKMAALKQRTIGKDGNEFYRLCMPRLEVGLRGLGIHGELDGNDMYGFPLKNPITDLNSLDDPFVSGVKLGYLFGFKQAYNEKRNLSLEMEKGNNIMIGGSALSKDLSKETLYLATASARKAATMAAKKVLPVAIREGYLATLKVSVRAGMLITSETGSRLAAITCKGYGAEAGHEAGRSVLSQFLKVIPDLDEDGRRILANVSESHGTQSGSETGELIGAVIGKAAAEEAYKRSIIRGGKIDLAKFHLDEYSAGARLGFDHGLKQGEAVATSASLDPSAPKFFRLERPVFTTIVKSSYGTDFWERDLIPPLEDEVIEELRRLRKHTLIHGFLVGPYMVTKEVKRGLERVSLTNVTYELEVSANGFIMDNIAYLTLSGTIDKIGALRGSLIATNIFNDDVKL